MLSHGVLVFKLRQCTGNEPELLILYFIISYHIMSYRHILLYYNSLAMLCRDMLLYHVLFCCVMLCCVSEFCCVVICCFMLHHSVSCYCKVQMLLPKEKVPAKTFGRL